MSAYIITNSELVAIANAIREKLSSDNIFTLDDMPTAIANIGTITGSGATVAVGNNTKYLINETKLTAIADAVRLKNGSNSQYLLSELPQAILDIVTITYTVNYYNGSTLLYSEDVPAGNNSSYVGSTPTKTQDAQYSYTFSGWSDGADDNTVDSNALNNITEDKNVYACFTSALRTYTVTFIRAAADGGGTLQTLNNIAYGTVLTNSSYTGSTPTTTQGSGSDYAFLGWTPSFTAITGNTTYTARFDNPVKEITDTWDQIIQHIDVGDYNTRYKVGNYKPLNLGTEGTINMQIVAMDADELEDSGYAPLTFIGMELLATQHRMNSSNSNNAEGTGTIGGWEKSEMRTYLKGTIKPLIPSNIRSRINNVKKWSAIYDTSGSQVQNSVSIDDVWIPGYKEIFNSTGYETSGLAYSTLYKSVASRIKNRNKTAKSWWLRSAYNTSKFSLVDGSGYQDMIVAGNPFCVCLGFCLGLEPEEPTPPVGLIEDSWETIISKINSGKAKYQVGSYKPLDLGSEGIVNMQIIGKNTSPLASGSGTATYDWLSMELLKTDHRMNPSNNKNAEGTGSIGGWEKCEMRTYLKETIKPLIPETVRNAIKEVTKYSRICNTRGTAVNDVASTEDVWIPSRREMFGAIGNEETMGPIYDGIFPDNTSRMKKKIGASSASWWWLRSAFNTNLFNGVGNSGGSSTNYAYNSFPLALGFSL